MPKNKLQFSVRKEVPMKRNAVMITLVLAIGIAIGMIGSQLINAQQPPPKSPVLLRTDLSGIESKEGVILLSEIAPGAVGGKHYHPGHMFGYVIEGSMIMEFEGKPPVTFKAGETFYLAPKEVHYAKNVSTTAPVKVLNFSIADKGQPLNVPVK
jgi:quercetin dioxygenase-like cupin family protein